MPVPLCLMTSWKKSESLGLFHLERKNSLPGEGVNEFLSWASQNIPFLSAAHTHGASKAHSWVSTGKGELTQGEGEGQERGHLRASLGGFA
jgi:hypothetical protein